MLLPGVAASRAPLHSRSRAVPSLTSKEEGKGLSSLPPGRGDTEEGFCLCSKGRSVLEPSNGAPAPPQPSHAMLAITAWEQTVQSVMGERKGC